MQFGLHEHSSPAFRFISGNIAWQSREFGQNASNMFCDFQLRTWRAFASMGHNRVKVFQGDGASGENQTNGRRRKHYILSIQRNAVEAKIPAENALLHWELGEAPQVQAGQVNPVSPGSALKNNARDDILGGIPKKTIAGLFPSLPLERRSIATAQILSVQN
jgi:hypothetical protein